MNPDFSNPRFSNLAIFQFFEAVFCSLAKKCSEKFTLDSSNLGGSKNRGSTVNFTFGSVL